MRVVVVVRSILVVLHLLLRCSPDLRIEAILRRRGLRVRERLRNQCIWRVKAWEKRIVSNECELASKQ